jgi:hypothetical protein
VFSPIPVVQRARLIERLNLLVEYQKTQQWAKQYDLLASLFKRAQGKRDFIDNTKQAYSRWGRTPLLSFTPIGVKLVQVDANRRVWFISGCSLVSEKGDKVNKRAVVEAYWEKNDWFFSEVQSLDTAEPDNLCAQTPELPQLSGLVNDFAAVLEGQTRDLIEKTLADFKSRTGIDISIVTVKTTGDLSAYDYSLGLARRRWERQGDSGKGGLLILIAINDRRWHIQVSRSLEATLPDSEVYQCIGSLS